MENVWEYCVENVLEHRAEKCGEYDLKYLGKSVGKSVWICVGKCVAKCLEKVRGNYVVTVLQNVWE